MKFIHSLGHSKFNNESCSIDRYYPIVKVSILTNRYYNMEIHIK